nr:hypothetical protein [Tanacetum cinerariifolium]
ALPNWFHEAHMESSNSDAQDACNADVLESSGISNPTATSKTPPAEQMESLTVESKFPTVSSPVPTVFLDISPETSSADISNMESSIPASPTPTFRIHKDHPKSQIIGPVDTPVQTRHKSKEEEPKKIFDALKDPSWIEAMQEELLQFKIQNVWILLDLAQGHTQEEGINYKEVFAPVARIEAIRLFLAYASFMGFTVYQMDVKSAFLYGTIDEEVYVMQPPGFQDLEFPNRVYKVEKAMGTIDQTLFIRKHKGEFLLVQVYVDDIIFGSSNPQLCRDFEALMHDKFQMSAMGELTFFLSLQVLQKKDGIFLSQDKYVGDILKKFGYSDVRSMIRSLMYLIASRPDIMFVVCAYARNQVTPKECHLHAVKRIFRYLKGHLKLGLCNLIMAKLAFCDYHNMIAILEKTEHNIDFHQIVDFIEASHIMYALTINPIVYVSHIRQFWSTARIETTNEETKILATVDGKPRTISESSLRRHLKLNDAEGISSLPDTELFENLSLMGYNILPNQRFTFQKGKFSHYLSFSGRTVPLFASMLVTQGKGSTIPTEPHHTPSSQEQHSSHHDTSSPSHPTTTIEPIPPTPIKTPTETPTLRQYSRRATQIAQSKALSPAAYEPVSLLRDDSQGEAFPTVSSLDAGHDRENINKTSALPHESSTRVTSLDADEGNLEISSLKARVKILKDKDRGREELAQEDAPIKRGSMEIGEEVRVERRTELGSNDTEEMVNVLSTMKAANILTSGVVAISVSPVAAATTVGVPTVSGLVPTVSEIFTTASVVTPYSRRPREISAKDKGKEKVRLSEQLARDSKIARLHAEEELKMMIEGLDRSNEIIAKHLHEYEQAAVDLSIREKIELINELKQIEDFVPMSSKEEGERMKRKGLKLDQGSAKKIKTSEEDLKGMMQLVPLEEVYVKALQVKHPIIDWEIHCEGQREEDLHQLWILVKETLSIKQATKDKEKELWVELKRLFKPDFED